MIVLKYTHDYFSDTTFMRTDWAVILTFTSEDENYGTEVAVFRGKKLKEIIELVELASSDTSTEELIEQNEEAAALRAEYMTTSLYAWHNMLQSLKKVSREKLEEWMDEDDPVRFGGELIRKIFRIY